MFKDSNNQQYTGTPHDTHDVYIDDSILHGPGLSKANTFTKNDPEYIGMFGSQAKQKKESITAMATPQKKDKAIRKCNTVLKKSKCEKSGVDFDDSFMRDLP